MEAGRACLATGASASAAIAAAAEASPSSGTTAAVQAGCHEGGPGQPLSRTFTGVTPCARKLTEIKKKERKRRTKEQKSITKEIELFSHIREEFLFSYYV